MLRRRPRGRGLCSRGRRRRHRRGRRPRSQTLSSSLPTSRTWVLVGSSLASPARTWPSCARSTTFALAVTYLRTRITATGAGTATRHWIALCWPSYRGTPNATNRVTDAAPRAEMVAALMTGSDLAKFVTVFTSLLAVGVPEEGGLGEDEVEEGVGAVRRLAPQALDDSADEGAEGAVLIRELAVGRLERRDAPTVLDTALVQAGDLYVLTLGGGHEAGEARVKALGLSRRLAVLEVLALGVGGPDRATSEDQDSDSGAATQRLRYLVDGIIHSPPRPILSTRLRVRRKSLSVSARISRAHVPMHRSSARAPDPPDPPSVCSQESIA